MSNYHELYKLGPTPIARGGQAEVFRAQHRSTGLIVALKRRLGPSTADVDRMRREITVQSAIHHVNVMPILDFDSENYAWFTMPLADAALDKVNVPITTELLANVLRDAARGLQAAHALQYVHRDIKPSNLLKLTDDLGPRWVVADWGIVRQAVGLTTANHTRTGFLLGSDGFAPPEAYSNAHDATVGWDVYSIGRIAVWASSGVFPTPLLDAAAPEPWRRFARLLTAQDARNRPQTMDRVLELIELAAGGPERTPGIVNDELKKAKEGDSGATERVLRAAMEHADDGALFIDDIAEVSGPGLDAFVRSEPFLARELLHKMEFHLGSLEWGYRDFNHYNVPLQWMQRVADAAQMAGDLDLLEDACSALFRCEPGHDRWLQAKRSRVWIASLRGEAAARVALLLRENPDAARYYGDLPNAADAKIRDVLRNAPQRHANE